jgi:hypothetical protein
VVTKAFGHVELALDDLLDQLHAGDDPPGVEERLEPKPRSHPRLDVPVVLLHDVVQVGARADVDRAFPTVIKVKPRKLRPGDRIVVKAGQVVPGDGEIMQGIASIDESAITGESAPVICEAEGVRTCVSGGTLVVSGQIVV